MPYLGQEHCYVIVDVEMIDNDTWMAVGFVTVHYPSGEIKAVEEFYTDRSKHKIENVDKRLFWETNKVAFDHNIKSGLGISQNTAEQSICEYVKNLRNLYPHFALVSDNPSLDVAVIDAILIKHGEEPLSYRTKNLYAQTLCTWSFRQGIAAALGMKASKLLDSSSGTYHSRIPRVQALPLLPAHTVFRDCCKTMADFFRCLDLCQSLIKQYPAVVVPPHTRPAVVPPFVVS